MKKNKVNQITLCAILVSMALVLSYIEHFIPLQMVLPMPGVKLGLANIVTLMALFFLGTGDAFTILILRCMLGSVFGGGISGLAFSMVGGVFAMTVMCIFRNCKRISIYGVSVLGAAAHNIGQILAHQSRYGTLPSDRGFRRAPAVFRAQSGRSPSPTGPACHSSPSNCRRVHRPSRS